MARIPYPDPSVVSPELRERLIKFGNYNVMRMMSHSEGLLNVWSKMGVQLMHRGKLDPRLRELVILRIGQLCRSEYEWHQHENVARAVGVDERTLKAFKAEDFSGLTEDQQVALMFAEDMQIHGAVSRETFAKARARFSSEQLVELSVLASYYIMTAGFLLSFDVDIDEIAPLGESFKYQRKA